MCLFTGASGMLGTRFIECCAERYQFVAMHHQNAISYATEEQEFVDPLSVSRQLSLNQHRVYSIRADLRDPAQIDRTIREVQDRFGSIDLLINSAAVRHWAGLLEPGGIDRAEEILKLNVLTPLRFSVGLAHAFWSSDPEANVRANRNIINISSTAGLFVYPDSGQALYATSKAALNHLTCHLASEFWDIGIRVNAVAPNTFPGRVPIEEVIESILMLDNSDVTGQVIRLGHES